MSQIEVPDYPPIAQFAGGWDLWQLPRPAHGSPLWVELKLVNRALPKRWGARRTFRVCWGVDVGRLRRGGAVLGLQGQEPQTYEALLQFLAASYTPARLEARIGAAALGAERARVEEAAARVKAAKALRRMLA